MRHAEISISPGVVSGRPTTRKSQVRQRLAPDTLKGLSLALKESWQRYRERLRYCQHSFTEDAVHDFRVEARRLQSLLQLLAPFLLRGGLQKTQTALKRNLDIFDELRDTQVQLLALRKLRKQFAAARWFHRFLKKQEAQLSKLTRKRVKRLRHKPLSELIASCRRDVKAWRKVDQDSIEVNRVLFRGVNRAFLDTLALKERISPGDTHSIHRTRIAFKKFRYALEALAGHSSWVNKRLLNRLRRYQALMGGIQDAAVLVQAFESFVRNQATGAEASARFERALKKRRDKAIRTFLTAKDQLTGFWPQSVSATKRRQTAPTTPLRA
jgi:CHAD domain-containing protein